MSLGAEVGVSRHHLDLCRRFVGHHLTLFTLRLPTSLLPVVPPARTLWMHYSVLLDQDIFLMIYEHLCQDDFIKSRKPISPFAPAIYLLTLDFS